MKFYQIQNTKTGEMKIGGLWKFTKRGGKVWTTLGAFHNMINTHISVYGRSEPIMFKDWVVIITDGATKEYIPALEYCHFKKLLKKVDNVQK